MLKCEYEACQWPSCDNSCGGAPKSADSSEATLVSELIKQVNSLKEDVTAYKTAIDTIKSIAIHVPHLTNDDYTPTCPYGYTDCILDPAYLRKYHFKWWKERLGMRTTCDCVDGEGYDDEDK